MPERSLEQRLADLRRAMDSGRYQYRDAADSELGNPAALDALSQAATDAWLERSSLTYLECAVSLMLTHMSKARVVEVLRTEARMVEEFD